MKETEWTGLGHGTSMTWEDKDGGIVFTGPKRTLTAFIWTGSLGHSQVHGKDHQDFQV